MDKLERVRLMQARKDEDIRTDRYLVDSLEAVGMAVPPNLLWRARQPLSTEAASNPEQPEMVKVDPSEQLDIDQPDETVHVPPGGEWSPQGLSSFYDETLAKRVDNDLRYHPSKMGGESGTRHDIVRGLCMALAKELNHLLPPGRPKSEVFTRLQDVEFWANNAIAVADLDK